MFRVIVHRALHEGGTKFYQQVKIECQDTNQCWLIQHWGKWLSGPHGFDIAGGQRKKMATSLAKGDSEYFDKLQAKRKRGYRTSDEKRDSLASLPALNDYIRKQLGGSNAQAVEIVEYFEEGLDAHGMLETVSAPMAPITAKTARDVPETEGWGSW